MFWATAPGTKAREAEEKIARELGIVLRECKPIEGFAHGAIAGHALVNAAPIVSKGVKTVQAILVRPLLWEERVRLALSLVTEYLTRPGT